LTNSKITEKFLIIISHFVVDNENIAAQDDLDSNFFQELARGP